LKVLTDLDKDFIKNIDENELFDEMDYVKNLIQVKEEELRDYIHLYNTCVKKIDF